ncbi:MAG: hypothetical protein KME15_25250 [Drouetiella hepatica Uher 2000/2452]|jgi:hypothetical protein|uniref:Uncharacterized protein n=1 Tax=Drouetiella hepatica Uher 2000/2452 TaxID=904376 RepID=A0A951QHN0_9CYAN|nr:hypothetical protein [Drouetiella hepatica Uher 2000/2452]
MYKFASDDGFRAGLTAWLIFILLFLLAGFQAELCILLGAMAGLAVWNIVGYLKAEEVKADAEPETPEQQPSVFRQVGSRVFERIRRPSLTKEDAPDAPADTGRGSTAQRGLRRSSKRYIGRRPPKRIGK